MMYWILVALIGPNLFTTQYKDLMLCSTACQSLRNMEHVQCACILKEPEEKKK